jgi:hypothetical protein
MWGILTAVLQCIMYEFEIKPCKVQQHSVSCGQLCPKFDVSRCMVYWCNWTAESLYFEWYMCTCKQFMRYGDLNSFPVLSLHQQHLNFPTLCDHILSLCVSLRCLLWHIFFRVVCLREQQMAGGLDFLNQPVCMFLCLLQLIGMGSEVKRMEQG